MYYAADEWRKMFDAWSFFCFKIAGFEIVRTDRMGLGIVWVLFTLFLYSVFHLERLYIVRRNKIYSTDLYAVAVFKDSWLS